MQHYAFFLSEILAPLACPLMYGGEDELQPLLYGWDGGFSRKKYVAVGNDIRAFLN